MSKNITLPREVVEYAIAALESSLVRAPGGTTRRERDSITALRTHLAAEQPKPEPVAWQYKGEPSFDGNRWHENYQVTTNEQVAKFKDKSAQPLYAAPPDIEALRRDAESLESLYHPATEILIEGLKKIGTEDAKRVLSAWDSGREIFDNRFLSRRDKT